MKALFQHQAEAVGRVLAVLGSANPTVLVAPTGAGKTIMGAQIAERFGRVLWVANRVELIDQARAETANNVQVMSVISALRRGPKHVDLLVIDEAHRGMARTYRVLIEKYTGAAVLGLTATPLRTDGQGLCDIFSEMAICSSPKSLIEGGYLVPYRAFEAPDEALNQLPGLSKVRGDYDQTELARLINTPRLVGNVVREYLRHATGRPAICFAVSIKHSKALVEEFARAGVRAAHLDAKSKPARRKALIDQLRDGHLDVLSNVSLFTEGWDCPPVSCVIMARPTQSLTLYLQSVGRGMRPSEGKRDLVILDHAANIHRHGYPDAERDWSLENDVQRARREAEVAELERCYALGFDSLEAELEERRRRDDETAREWMASSELAARLEEIGYGRLPWAFAKTHGIAVAARPSRPGRFYHRRQAESAIAELRLPRAVISLSEYASGCGITSQQCRNILKTHGLLIVRGKRAWIAEEGQRFLKEYLAPPSGCVSMSDLAKTLCQNEDSFRVRVNRLGVPLAMHRGTGYIDADGQARLRKFFSEVEPEDWVRSCELVRELQINEGTLKYRLKALHSQVRVIRRAVYISPESAQAVRSYYREKRSTNL